MVAKKAKGRKQKGEQRAARRKRATQRAQWRTVGDGKRLLAFDVSSVCVGWSLFCDGKLTEHGKYLQAGKGHGERLSAFTDWAHTMFKKYKPTTVAVEAPFQGRHRYAFAVLSMYRAALLIAHWEAFGVELAAENQIPAHTIKKTLGVEKAPTKDPAKRHAFNKQVVIEEINRLYQTRFRYVGDDAAKRKSDDDIADAVAVGHAWYALHAPEAA